ncbi:MULTISPECIES: cysteine synthase A [Brochothrix]|uniref:Cysteine synthase n=1 Tax=Brochothrix thermosphacta TaxID=2756 RepID=A0A2X0PVX8_BROTH|nr:MULTISPECIES: cysteine synthase A [Brochothrix]SLM93572.1 Cysteine synthase [Brachybacterium faecium]ANZ95081.1 cysteine synthase A [Brochothrix thermosphacta]ANZ96615.1 cysteine synthase A [Brochothrix thermosphacta]EUJ34373.1 cysteine synthase A [Brochothrix thermosphacta DSM 20171 = FSL F6-1036]MBR5525790.1 cysteine synthase A [Brochothrix sp.]
MAIYNSALDLVGSTPIVKLNRLVKEGDAEVYVKLEYQNPGGSVKDRIAKAMIEDAEKAGLLKTGDTIVEPTSGNTGIGLAFVAAVKGYASVFVMPDTMSIERRKLLEAYGAKLVLTPGAEGMKGAIAKAKELSETDGYFMPQQFSNPSNPAIHETTTGPEILADFGDKGLDAFIAGVGTGGTISGVGHVLKKANPDVKIYALEPLESPVLAGGNPSPHKIQGIGAGFIPDTLDTEVYDGILQVSSENALKTARLVASQEGLLVGISSGATIYAALEQAAKLGAGKKILAIVASNGERYLSTPLYEFDDQV